MKLTVALFGTELQNPVLLASGTCGFGRELAEVIDLEALGGFVTKSVTLEAREGNPPLRVTEFGGGMLNSVGLANPGLEGARREELPWIAANVRRARVFVSVAGHSIDDYFRLVEGLDASDGFLGFELNLSCPNDARRGGPPFALEPEAVATIVTGCRTRTERPILAKLAPNDARIGETARVATEAGADGLTLVNTMPGLLVAPGGGQAELGAGEGGMSGPALRPIALRAVKAARAYTHLPIVGVGGVLAPRDAIAFARCGASLVQLGTASFAAPQAAAGLVRGLERWGRRHGVPAWTDLVAPAPSAPSERLAAAATR